MTTRPQVPIEVRREFNEALRNLFPGLPREEQIRNLRLLFDQGQPVEAPVSVTEVLEFSISVPALTRVTQNRYILADSHITQAFFHFPPGPSFLVDVRVLKLFGRTEEQIIPTQRDTFIALDAAILPLTGLRIGMEAGSEIQVEWLNYDSANAHEVPVIMVVST